MPPSSKHYSTKSLDSLAADLNCESPIKCRNARRALVEKGQEAVAALIDALKNGREIVPLEAAKALGNIGGPEAIRALIDALEDERFEVRWEAAEALIKIGTYSVKPLLKTLIHKSDSSWIREGAHHVFSELWDTEVYRMLVSVLNALDDDMPRLEVPVAAKKVLDELE